MQFKNTPLIWGDGSHEAVTHGGGNKARPNEEEESKVPRMQLLRGTHSQGYANETPPSSHLSLGTRGRDWRGASEGLMLCLDLEAGNRGEFPSLATH